VIRASAARCVRQVGDGAEAAEALAEDAPRPPPGEPAPDQLGVGHDRVGPEMGQVVGLGPGVPEVGQGAPVGGGGAPGPALVEQQHPVVLQRPVQPALPPGGPQRAEPGTALQVQQPRQVGRGLVRRDHLSGEDLDLLAARPGVIQRHGEGVVDQDGSRLVVRGHARHRTGRPRSRRRRAGPRPRPHRRLTGPARHRVSGTQPTPEDTIWLARGEMAPVTWSMTSGGTPAARSAATRCPATRSKCFCSMPRPWWASRRLAPA